MRKEADDAGPMAELQHWRQRMAKFNSLLEQLKTKQCRTIIGILVVAKSKVLKVRLKKFAVLILFTVSLLTRQIVSFLPHIKTTKL